MNILIDIAHPAHVHYYRNLSKELEKKGHFILWTIRNVPLIKHLMDKYILNYIVLPEKSDTILFKGIRQVDYLFRLRSICKKYSIDIAIGNSAAIPHLSLITSIKSIMFDDDDDAVQPLIARFVSPFADTLLSPEALKGKRRRKDTIFFPGYMELAYLHPYRFTPDLSVLTEAGIEEEDTFFIMRFNVFKAHHDIGVKGLSLDQKLRLIDLLKPHGKIFITTERTIEPELKPYQLPVAPEKIHSLMAFSTLFIGDSQTMTSEAAVLGIPSLRCNTFARSISYLTEQEEKYQLTYAFYPHEFDKMLNKLDELLKTHNIKQIWQQRRQKMLNDKIDVTAFMQWFVENYPESKTLAAQQDFNWNQFR